jgi:prepilin-type N-terminal cleavage/methylation domain-containing protein
VINVNKKANEKGFTLIELLVVVAIIAILALIVLLALNPVEMARRSRDSRRLSDLGTLRRAIDLALSDGESLEATGAGGVTIDTSTSVTNFATASGPDISKYLSVVPEDPYNGTNNPQTLANASCDTQTTVMPSYSYWSDGDTYIIRSYIESTENCVAATEDGNSNGTYELGTEPGLDAF